MTATRAVLLQLSALVLCGVSTAAFAQSAYRVQLVSVGFDPAVFELNNKGEIVGVQFGVIEGSRAVIWRDGQSQLLPDPAGSVPQTTYGVSINDNSDVVGTVLVPDPADPESRLFRTFLWTQGRYLPLIGPPTGEYTAWPLQINNRRQILVVASSVDQPNERLYVWEAGRYTRQLTPDTPDPRRFVDARFNDRGEIILPTHLSSGGVLTPLKLPNRVPVVATAINNLGQVAGVAWPNNAPRRAVVWEFGGGSVLPQRAAGQATFAFSINNLGHAVGETYCPTNGRDIAVLWRDGASYNVSAYISGSDPQKPFVKITSGQMINDRGQIVARGFDTRDPSRGDRWYLLTPVP